MLFNSLEFIIFFLPITSVIYHWLRHLNLDSLSIYWLVAASLFFYGWWNPGYLVIILVSIIANYWFGSILSQRKSLKLLAVFVALNLASISYFKYFNFLIDNYNILFGQTVEVAKIVLPLAISFFTFQQITFLVDSYRGETQHYNFIEYCLFVTFFPQLIAGPIVHHKEMMPQFNNARIKKHNVRQEMDSQLALGVTLFAIGLFKKVALADNLALHATPYFEAVEKGDVLTVYEAWLAALSYTFQLYFDFSGYSDMAIGIANMFGIRLPINFFSPYKSSSIIEFWRRWHITLSRFLKDYVYVPLGGNRLGASRRYVNLALTMLLGGLWHGAGWTFIVWGGLHGLFLVANHLFRYLSARKGSPGTASSLSIFASLDIVLKTMLTFICVVSAWVVFRAESLSAAISILQSMYGFNGIALPGFLEDILGVSANGFITFGFLFVHDLSDYSDGILLIVLSSLVVFALPNVYQLTMRFKPVCDLGRLTPAKISWQPTAAWACVSATFFVTGILFANKVSEFLYFQF